MYFQRRSAPEPYYYFQGMASLLNIVCPLCPSVMQKLSNIKDYLKHIQLFHSHQPNFFITCGIDGCMRTFKSMGSFRNHVSSRHSCTAFPDYSSSVASTSLDNDACENSSSNEDDVEEFDIGVENADSATMLKKLSATFLLKLKEKQKLTQTSLQSIIKGVTGLFQYHLDALHARINSKLIENGVSTTVLTDILELDDFRKPFRGLETYHQQIKFFRSHLNFIVKHGCCFCNTFYVCFHAGPYSCNSRRNTSVEGGGI